MEHNRIILNARCQIRKPSQNKFVTILASGESEVHLCDVQPLVLFFAVRRKGEPIGPGVSQESKGLIWNIQ